jgi:hypothetical protein
MAKLPSYVFDQTSDLPPQKLNSLLKIVHDIHAKAENCAATSAHEAQWLLKVIIPLLQFSIEHLNLDEKLQITDV